MISLSKEQKSILIGTILGDGYLQKTGKRNARLRLEHGYRQKDYLLWKVKKLGNLFQGRPRYLERIHPKTKRKYRYYRHQSQSTPYLGKLRTLFYPTGKKKIPGQLKKFLDPLALAVWYMDDGYYYPRDKCSYLYLGDIKKEEAEIVKKALFEKFGLVVRIKRKKRGYALYFSPQETQKLKKLIKEFVLVQLKYKLPS
jgi:recombination protein RecA